MRRNDSQFQPLGICQRVFNFFKNKLFAPGLKRITLGHPLSHRSIEVPLDDPLRNGGTEGDHQAHDDSEFEIQVHFKQTEEESESWIPIDKLGSSVHEAKKDGPSFGGDQPQLKKDDDNSRISISAATREKSRLTNDKVRINQASPQVQVNGIIGNGTSLSKVLEAADATNQGESSHDATTRGKAPQAIELILTTLAPGTGPKRVVSIKDDAEEDKAKKKGKNITGEKLAPALTTDPKDKEVYPRHYLHVVPNVNEKSSQFIESRKAMMGNTSQEPKKSEPPQKSEPKKPEPPKKSEPKKPEPPKKSERTWW